MPRFTCEAEFGLITTIEPDFYGSDIGDNSAEDYSDNSSFGGVDVEVNGGLLTFVVHAEDEAEAEGLAGRVIYDGCEVEDRDALTWQVTDVSISVERDELSRDEALVIVRRFLDGLVAAGSLPSDVREAFDVLLQDS